MSNTLQIIASVGGVAVNKTITFSEDHQNTYGDGETNIVLSAGTEPTSWTLSSSTEAVAALSSGHGLTSGAYDVYWPAGYSLGCTGVVVSNDLTLTYGSGDAFPDTDTTGIVVCKQQQINTAIDGDEVGLFVVMATAQATAVFNDADGDTIATIPLEADVPYVWHSSSGFTNPLAGDSITVCYATNGTATDAVITIMSAEDSTP